MERLFHGSHARKQARVPGCVLQPKKIGKTTARDFQTPPNQQMYTFFVGKPIDFLKMSVKLQKMAVVFFWRQVLPSEPRIMDDGRRGGKFCDFLNPAEMGPEYFFLDPF